MKYKVIIQPIPTFYDAPEHVDNLLIKLIKQYLSRQIWVYDLQFFPPACYFYKAQYCSSGL